MIKFPASLRGMYLARRADSKATWRSVLGELIDNAFDAGARRVTITRSGKELLVTDDGKGCCDLSQMLRIGGHFKKSTTVIGMHGVGFKDAAWAIGGPVVIESIHAGKYRRVRLDWENLEEFECADDYEGDAAGFGWEGTRLRFERMAMRFPDGKAFDERLAELAKMYSPATDDGLQIIFKNGTAKAIMLRPVPLPEMSEVVDATIDLDGKRATVHVGIVKEGVENLDGGISYEHGFRVITHGALGANGHGTARIAGRVKLSSGWGLSRNKDDLTEANRQALGDAVFEKIRHLVIKASSQALVLRSTALSNDLSTMFQGIVGGVEKNARAKRNRSRRKSGTVSPTGNGPGHTRATRTQSGRTFSESAGQFRIEFKPLSQGRIGNVDQDGKTIELNDSHPGINLAKSTDNRLALIVAAVNLFAQYDCDRNQSTLAICRSGVIAREVSVIAGHLLSSITDIEQAAIRKAS